MKKTILGLDLGTNSIGWAVIKNNLEDIESIDNGSNETNLIGIGSRIIPMDQATLSDFENGISKSSTAERTRYRGIRRLNQRHLLRRERLLRIFNIIGILPKHYAEAIDFETHFGQFKANNETNIAYEELENGKFDFIFKESFAEMTEEFKNTHPTLFVNNNKIPYDWTIYYLRKKALTHKITKYELAWLLLNFNQKRGYYQLRGEDDDVVNTKMEEYHALKVLSVSAREKGKGDDEIWYDVVLENGWIYKRSSKTPLDWVGKIKDFIVTTELLEDGSIKTDKDGKEKRSFRAPSENDWGLVKKKTEQQIESSKKTVGEYIYQNMLEKPFQKINGKLVRTIERNYYKTELDAILKCQIPLHKELTDDKLYEQCINHLYANNDAHRNNIRNRGFAYLIQDDILFYQRPLKCKKSEISNCEFETRHYVLDGETKTQSLKCIPKSHPDYQEFRLWQFLANIKIYKRQDFIDGKMQFDIDFTSSKINSEEEKVNLFDFLNGKYDITQKQFLAFYKLKEDEYRWNYVEDKTYPCNETRSHL
jgi:CRISPR-associated endonuclease Csn1